jgi:hypothetical protein
MVSNVRSGSLIGIYNARKSTNTPVSSDFAEALKNVDKLSINKQQSVTYSPGILINTQKPQKSIAERLTNIRKEDDEFDYSGMTRAEKYVTIENRFKNEFPDEYLIAMDFSSVTLGMSSFNDITNEFWSEISKHQLYGISLEDTNEARGFGGMSPDEIYDAIAKKYEGKTTVRDQLKFMAELSETNVLYEKAKENNVSLGPLFNEAVCQGLITEYGLYNEDNVVDPAAFENAMNSSASSLSDIAKLTKHAIFIDTSAFDAIMKVFENEDKKEKHNK